MNAPALRAALWVLAIGFTLAFAWLCGPPLLANPDIVGAFGAGFVNPFSSGYAMDAITTWCVLAAWVAYEARVRGVRHGWVALVLGVVPGVAVGLASYLLLRMKQDKA